MVTNNAPFCHRHLRVKVKKHICHSRCTAEDDGTGIKKWWMEEGTEDKEEGEGKGRAAISDMEKNRTYLLVVGWEMCSGGAQGEWEFRIN